MFFCYLFWLVLLFVVVVFVVEILELQCVVGVLQVVNVVYMLCQIFEVCVWLEGVFIGDVVQFYWFSVVCISE